MSEADEGLFRGDSDGYQPPDEGDFSDDVDSYDEGLRPLIEAWKGMREGWWNRPATRRTGRS